MASDEAATPALGVPPAQVSPPAQGPAAPAREVVARHAAITRLTHWINVVCIAVLLMSGFQIFNAHPALYWGQKGADFDRHIFALPRGFPHWATIPSWQDLATGRLWHFAFAWIFGINLLVYLLFGLLSGHFRRDFVPTRDQLAHIGSSVWDHLRLKFPKGEEARAYNVLQKFSYIGVVILLPLMLATGFTMSPGMDSAFPWLLDLFGGRQSDRTLHFIFAWLIVAFVAIHLIAILAAGPINEIGSMITGRWTLEHDRDEPDDLHEDAA
jgi:Ni/Fe-hydrogenase b-type cytochrome subunit